MRKLNKQNKIYITLLSLFVIICLVVIAIFIIYKIKDYNIKYKILPVSYVFNSDKELITIKDNTYAKKDFFRNYYLIDNENKISLGKNVVIYNSSDNEITLLGTFYEILENGETKKYSGESIFSSYLNKIFKIDDRKYLVTGKTIKTEDDLLTTENYLLIDLDKVGNSYVYNNVINYKSFGILNLITDTFNFKTNEEILILNNEEIDLTKIKGSTNEYNKQKKEYLDNTNNNNPSNIYEEEQVFINNIYQTITENKYVSHKTTIFDAKASNSSIDLTYMVYDPLTEFTKVYVNLYTNDVFVGTYELASNETNYTLKGLKSNTLYHLEFFYDYMVDDALVSKKFDMLDVKTLNVKGQITLEKVSNNSVSYILKVDDSLDSAVANLYIDGMLASTDNNLNIENAKSSDGYSGLFNFSSLGSTYEIVIDNGVYNLENVGVIATYKFKM
ncbi:MAG: hypothetical protein ACI4XR_05645 [Bacilli bacterium]